jgi:hypothetical protein
MGYTLGAGWATLVFGSGVFLAICVFCMYVDYQLDAYVEATTGVSLEGDQDEPSSGRAAKSRETDFDDMENPVYEQGE